MATREQVRASLVRTAVLAALKGADVEWRDAAAIQALVAPTFDPDGFSEPPTFAEVRDALRHLVSYGPEVMRRQGSGGPEYRLHDLHDALQGEAPTEPEGPPSRMTRAVQALAEATLPNPAEPGFSMRRSFDGTWSVQVDGLTEREARALAVTFGDRMSRRD